MIAHALLLGVIAIGIAVVAGVSAHFPSARPIQSARPTHKPAKRLLHAAAAVTVGEGRAGSCHTRGDSMISLHSSARVNARPFREGRDDIGLSAILIALDEAAIADRDLYA